MESRLFEFQVLSVGLSRTGTTSLSIALDELLVGKCLDLEFYRLNPFKTVRLLEDPKVSNEEFKNFFEVHNLVAALQFPIFTKYKRMLEVFPEAKVILTVRDPERWVKSMSLTTCVLKKNFRTFPLNLYFFLTDLFKLQTKLAKFVYYYVTERTHKQMEFAVTSGKGVQYYNDWIDEVRRTVPGDRLLVYNLNEGWEPLCKFLEVPVPNIPFPNVNKQKDFLAMSQKKDESLIHASWFVVFLITLLVSIILGVCAQMLYGKY